MTIDLPCDRVAEIGVIGACLDGGIETCLVAFESVPDKAFYHDDLRMAFQCLEALVRKGVKPDTIALMSEWKRLGCGMEFPLADLAMAQDRSPAFMLPDRSETVLDSFMRRRAIMSAHRLSEMASDAATPVQDAIRAIYDDLSDAQSRTPTIYEPKAGASLLIDDLERRHQLQGKRSGIPTGIESLDEITDGLQLGEFWVIGARPSVGKTTLGLNIAESVVFKEKIPCLFVSLEMTAASLLRRMLSMCSRIDSRSIRRGLFNQGDFKSMTAFTARLSASPFYVMDAPGGAKDSVICNAIRASVRRWGVKVVILDYIQKIKPENKGEKRTYEIGDTTSRLVEVAKRENICLLSLAQLNRDKDKQQRSPIVSDLADSKAIEADADFIGLLDRPVLDREGKLTDELARLHIAKQRDGERGILDLKFDGKHHRFSQLEYECGTSSGTNGSSQGRIWSAVDYRTPAEIPET